MCAKDSTSVVSGVASVRPGVNGTVIVRPAAFAAISMPTPPASTIRSAIDTVLPAPLNVPAMPSSLLSTGASATASLAGQLRCGSKRIRPPFAPPRLSL